MLKSIYLTGKSLNARISNIELVSNNLANINSTGYKRQIPFSEVLDQEGKTVIKQETDYTEGTKSQTSNPLDVAINGEGFFAVKTENGIQLTRNGSFKISDDGFLVNQNGDKVLGENGEININSYLLTDNQKLTIDKQGAIKIGDNNLGNLAIMEPDESFSLDRVSNSAFTSENANYVSADKSKYQISQGYLEESNVNAIVEMEDMIKINNEYESSYKIMQSLDQSLGQIIDAGKV